MDPSQLTLSSGECSICLTPINEDTLIDQEKPKILHCGHVFHTECIDEWLEIKSDCAYCRAVVSFTEIPSDPPPELSASVADSVMVMENVREHIAEVRRVRVINLAENRPEDRSDRLIRSVALSIFFR